MERLVAVATVFRAVLIGRLVIAIAAVGVSIRLVADPVGPALGLTLIAVTTLAELAWLARRPAVLHWRLSVLMVDAALMVAVLLISQGGVVYFCYAAGSAALAGALLGSGGLTLWVAQAALGVTVAIQLLRHLVPGAREVAAPFLLATPMTDLVCGLGAAVLAAGLTRSLELSIETAMTAQRSAAASERARLARELHDSVAKTLHGVSFAALALPSSLRRQPHLAEQLAATVQQGADVAVREARELLSALRRDVPDQPFADTVRGVCDAWTATSGIRVLLSAAPDEPTLAARYELTQILNEALRNVARHASATRVEVTVDRPAAGVRLTVRDDGAGFAVPADLSQLSTSGSFGLVGMSERAKTVGGTLRLESQPGAGTVLTVVAPAAAGVRREGAVVR
jgi:signal transduction histidine kinase